MSNQMFQGNSYHGEIDFLLQKHLSFQNSHDPPKFFNSSENFRHSTFHQPIFHRKQKAIKYANSNHVEKFTFIDRFLHLCPYFFELRREEKEMKIFTIISNFRGTSSFPSCGCGQSTVVGCLC